MSISDRKQPEINTFHIPSSYWNNFPGEDFLDTKERNLNKIKYWASATSQAVFGIIL